jgi:hypothetical protein
MNTQHKLTELNIRPASNSPGSFKVGPEIHSTIVGAASAAYAMGAATMADMLINALRDKRDVRLALEILAATESKKFFGRAS